MKTAYNLITELDCGVLGVRPVDVSYSYDKRYHLINIMGVWLIDGTNPGPEVTDYLSDVGEGEVYQLISIDLQRQLAEERAEAEEMAWERDRDERLMGDAV